MCLTQNHIPFQTMDEHLQRHIVRVLQKAALLLKYIVRREHHLEERLLVTSSHATACSAMIRNIFIVLCDLKGILPDFGSEHLHVDEREICEDAEISEFSIPEFERYSFVHLGRLQSSLQHIMNRLSIVRN